MSVTGHSYTALPFLVEGRDMFLILLIWFNLQIFVLILSESIQAFFCRSTSVKQITRSRLYQCEGEDKVGKSRTPAVLVCSGLSCGEAMFIVAFYGLLPASNHYEVNINLVSWKTGRNSWTSSGLAVFLVKGERIHFTTSGNIRVLCCVKMFFCLGNDFVKHWVFSQWIPQ